MKKIKFCLMAACMLLMLIAGAYGEAPVYRDIIDEITNSQKETAYNLDLNAPYSKDKSGVKEVVDPETGDVSIIYDLFSLKGRAGVNTINLSISYRNSEAKVKEENAEYADGVYTNVPAEKTQFQKSQSFLGTGWSLYFPYVEKQDEFNKTDIYVHLADGTAYRRDDSANGLENYDMEDVSFYDIDVTRSGVECAYMLRYIDGTCYYFDTEGYLCEKTDRFGNAVRYIWTTADDVKVIQYISDNCGQMVSFGYDGDIINIRFEGQNYCIKRSLNSDEAAELESITDPIGRKTDFEYYRADLEFNFFNADVKAEPETNPYYLIRRVNYPGGTETVYEYIRGRKWLYEKEDGYIDYVRLAKRYDTDYESVSNLYSYVYYNEPDGYPVYKPDEIPETYYYSTSEMDINGDGTAYNYDWRHYQYKTEIWGDNRKVSEEIKEYDPLTGMPVMFVVNTYNKNGEKQTVYNSTKFDRRKNVAEQDRYSAEETPGEHKKTYRYSEGYNICIYESYYRDKETLVELKRTLNPAGTAVGEEIMLCNGMELTRDSYGYDRYGNITESKIQTDKDDYLVTEYEYSPRYQNKLPVKQTVKNIKDADGAQETYCTEYEYDKYGNVTQTKDNEGNILRYEYDILGRCTKEILEDGKAREYQYNDIENLIHTIDAAGTRLLYDYDKYGRLTRVTDEITNQPLTSRVYDYRGRVIKETDANNNSQSYEYDGLDRYVTVEIKDAQGTLLSRKKIEYDEAYAAPEGMSLKMDIYDGTGEEIRQTQYLFDYENRVTRKSQISDGETRSEYYSYDYDGNNLTYTDTAGREIKMKYDAFGNCISVIYPDGSEASYEYNYINNPTKATDAVGESTLYEYDALGRLIKEELPGGSIFKTRYDYRGNVTEQTDAKGFKTEYEYDSRGFLTKQREYSTASEGIETEYTYDGEGRQLTYAYGAIGRENERHKYTNVLDHMGRIIQTIDNMGNMEYTEYDGNSNPIKITDRNGTLTERSYDGLNNVISETNSKNGTKIYEYNSFGELIGVKDDITEITYSYNGFGEITGIKDNYSNESYSYDISGNLTGYTKTDSDAGEISQSYKYDVMNRLTEVITPVGNEMLSYDKAGRIISKKNTGTGTEKTYTYNPNGTVKQVKTFQNGELTYSEYYEYDKNMNRIYADENGDITEYTYDGMSRLTEERKNREQITSYEFDGYNNIIRKDELLGTSMSTQRYEYDANNRLTAIIGEEGTDRYEYDKAGNMTEKATGMGGDITRSYYSYDGYNRLTGYVSETDTAEYTYSLAGLRETKTVNGERTRFVYHGGDIIGEIKEESIYKYYRGTELLGSICQNERRYYRTNLHGDITGITDETGEILKDYKYDAYGNKESIRINPEGADTILYQWRQETETEYNPFGYCGEYLDEETGFIYLRNRYYDPSTARFITEDPIRDGMNWYGYAGNNPVMYFDYWGLAGEPVLENLGFTLLEKMMYENMYKEINGVDKRVDLNNKSDVKAVANWVDNMVVSAKVNNTVIILARVKFENGGLPEDEFLKRQEMVKAGIRAWSGNFDYEGQSYTANVIITEPKSKRGNAINIILKNELGVSNITAFNMVNINAPTLNKSSDMTMYLGTESDGFYSDEAYSWTASHEFGHALGLFEAYTEYVPGGISGKVSTTVNSIMGYQIYVKGKIFPIDYQLMMQAQITQTAGMYTKYMQNYNDVFWR